jgi:AraC-like DNA-binding protein
MSEPRAESLTLVQRVTLAGGGVDMLSASRFAHWFPAHFHDTFAIGAIEAGRVRLATRDGERVGAAGTILAFAPGEVHGAHPLDGDGWTYSMIYPPAELMREIVPQWSREIGCLDSPVLHDPALADALARAQTHLSDGMRARNAEALLVRALRALVARHAHAAVSRQSARPRQLVRRAREIIHLEYTQPIRLHALATRCGCSPFHLARTFRECVGVAPHAYLVQLRVNRARALLADGASAFEVAHRCGFSDQAHFTRTFKRAVGVPPGLYARGIRRDAGV